MGNYERGKISNEKGVTLLEVLVSIVLISLILTMMITVFVQSASVNVASEEIIDATYVAQSEMEKIYSASRVTRYSMRDTVFEPSTRTDYTDHSTYEKVVEGYHVQFTLYDEELVENANLLVIEVIDSEGNMEAKVQNVIRWEADS